MPSASASLGVHPFRAMAAQAQDDELKPE